MIKDNRIKGVFLMIIGFISGLATDLYVFKFKFLLFTFLITLITFLITILFFSEYNDKRRR